jgi:hypothetical protein
LTRRKREVMKIQHDGNFGVSLSTNAHRYRKAKAKHLTSDYARNSSGLRLPKFENQNVGVDWKDFSGPSSLLRRAPPGKTGAEWSYGNHPSGKFFDPSLRSNLLVSTIRDKDYNLVGDCGVTPEWLNLETTNR